MKDIEIKISPSNEIQAFSGNKPKQLVIFLHGYGANGQDLLGLADYFKNTLPDSHFIAPDAPFICEESIFGYQWFSLRNRDEDFLFSGLSNASNILNKFIDQQLKRFDLTEENLILMGFSQGTMLSLHLGPRRLKPCKIIGFSGTLIKGMQLATDSKSKPPILLIHGKLDNVIDYRLFKASVAILEKLSFNIESQLFENLEHNIDFEGIELAQKFLEKFFL